MGACNVRLICRWVSRATINRCFLEDGVEKPYKCAGLPLSFLSHAHMNLSFIASIDVSQRRWHGVAVWKWDVNEDVCGICRLAFDACCPDCTVPGDSCSPGEFFCSSVVQALPPFEGTCVPVVDWRGLHR